MKKRLFLYLMPVFVTTAVHAQQISGIVKDDSNNELTGAVASLLRAKDSTVVDQNISVDGKYSFAAPTTDSFLVRINNIGFETTYSLKFYAAGEPVVLPTMILRKADVKLKDVVVSVRKPMVETKPDKIVLNVEGTINATGTDALELLRKSPGVMIDKDDQLSVNGKNGVQVYIDGRPSPLSSQDLSNYLKSLSSSQIEAIEIITNPSSQYEAAGTAGVINIRLKKNKSAGFNGNISTGINVSCHTRVDDGISLNYRNNKLNVYGSYNGAYGNTGMDFNLYRSLNDTTLDQKNKLLFKNNSHNFKAGADYTLNAKNSLGLMVNGSFATPTLENTNYTYISDQTTGKVARTLDAANINKMKNDNVNTNIYYTYADGKGKNLTLTGDYGYYSLKQSQWQPNTFLDAEGKNVTDTRNYQIESPTRIDIYSAKADYEQNTGIGRIGFGGKFGYVKTDNTFDQYNEHSGTLTLDRNASNFFRYAENVNAAYAKYSREFKGFALQGGLRAELTSINGDLRKWENGTTDWVAINQNFSKNYLDFFPSVSVTLAPKTANQLTLAYNRRIDRPVYKDLNPFEYRINEYGFHKGSTDLSPQYSNTVSLTYTYKFRLNTTLSYSHVDDVFGQVVDTAAGLKSFLSNRNLATQDITNLNMSYSFQYKAYSFFASANGYYSKYQASYGTGRDINIDTWAANFFMQNSYSFGKDWSAELSGFYTTPAIWQGSMKSASIWSADAGVQKKILQGKATVKVSVSDLFNSLKWSANSDFSGQKVWASGKQETRQLKLSFTYRFDNHQAKGPRQIQSGAEEESKRVQTSGLGN